MNDPLVQLSDCDIIKCSNCDKELFIIKNKTSNANIVSKLQVECPYCGDASYVYEAKGTFMYHPAVGVKVKNFVMKNDVMRFLTTK